MNTKRTLAGIAVLATCVAAPAPVGAGEITPPPVPTNIQAPADTRAFFAAHAVGTQNYSCVPSATSPSGFAWSLYGPQATLFDDEVEQVATHFLSPNPHEAGTPRATWQHARDTSAVWAAMIQQSSDSAYVAPGSIPWFLLQVFGAQAGPTGGDRLTRATYIQRVNTYGGVAPSTGCGAATDLGRKVLVPYEADYIFYMPRGGDND